MTAQLPLQFQPLARRSDPQTSHMAAESAKAFKARDISKIWNCLRDFGPQTYKQVAKLTMMEPVAVARRLAEMERGKLIEYTGEIEDKCRVMRARP